MDTTNHTTVPVRTCKSCSNTYPRTPEFWHKDKGSPDGLTYSCSNCARKRADDHFQANKTAKIQYQRAYYQAHKRQHALTGKAWAVSNPEKSATIKRAYIERFPDRRKQSANTYAHSEKGRISHQRRRARRDDLPDTITEEQWQTGMRYWHYGCAACGTTNSIHADHWIPLSSPDCPGTVASNIVPLCRHCNLSKKNRAPEQWLIKKFGEVKGRQIFVKVTTYLTQWNGRLF